MSHVITNGGLDEKGLKKRRLFFSLSSCVGISRYKVSLGAASFGMNTSLSKRRKKCNTKYCGMQLIRFCSLMNSVFIKYSIIIQRHQMNLLKGFPGILGVNIACEILDFQIDESPNTVSKSSRWNCSMSTIQKIPRR